MSEIRPQILFLHRNSLGQFEFFGAWLAKNGWDVTFAMGGNGPDQTVGDAQHCFFNLRKPEQDARDFRYSLEYAAQNALAAAEWMMMMRDTRGYAPDIVVSHVGWGVGLCAKKVWHRCCYVAYHEWYYTDQNWSKGGCLERPTDLATLVSSRMRTLPITAEFDTADENWCPTEFQASRFPPALRAQLTVIPDGVDCATCKPNPKARDLVEPLGIPKGVPLITYTTRGMEPLRGFPQFMRALSIVQTRIPELHALIVADEKVSYGPQLPNSLSWRQLMLDRYDFDQSRLHIKPMLPRPEYQRVLQASTAHVYFTEPFVTSWSLAEAMATGCLVIGSLTAPVEEFIENMVTGILVDMDDPVEVADMIEWVVEHEPEAASIRREARHQMQCRYNAKRIFRSKEKRLRSMLKSETKVFCSKA